MLLHPTLIRFIVLYPHDLAYISWSIHNSIVSTIFRLAAIFRFFGATFRPKIVCELLLVKKIRSPKFKTDTPIIFRSFS